MAMIPYLRRVEQDLRVILCNEVYAELLTKLDTKDLSEEYQTLIDLSKHYLANRALDLAIPQLRVLIEGDGIKAYLRQMPLIVRIQHKIRWSRIYASKQL